MSVLKRVRAWLAPGGAIACEEPHSSSLATVPRKRADRAVNQLFVELGKKQGLDFDIGDKLFDLLTSAGFADPQGCFVQPVISMAKAAEFVRMGAAEVAPFAVKCGMVSDAEAHRTLRDLQSLEIESGSYYVFPRQAQVFGFKR